ncbi:unnamed protein product [Moneuplotes crassus]|uniref:5'-nucleotidase n=1 Tax=Euplotes crassus TaxID=5936 RepID=A0AAD1U8J0_EUPCR|nr:unnamed protein product [Moneuplotes crassus]
MGCGTSKDSGNVEHAVERQEGKKEEEVKGGCKEHKTFHLIHFNDVYNINEKDTEPVGGAARFITAVEKYKDLNPLVLFSGDIFAPSKLSQTMKGKQMIPFLDKVGIDVTCVGNHDFDFGVYEFTLLKDKTNFPWLLSNVWDSKTKKIFGDCTDHHIMEHQGFKIGFIGLAELEWLGVCPYIEEEDYDYEDFVKCARRWCEDLKSQGCDLIIALTHMRVKNDKHLADQVPELDMILGGHDHFEADFNIHNTLVLKSGTDFRQFSLINVEMNCPEERLQEEKSALVVDHDKKRIIGWERVEITKQFDPNPEMQEIVDGYWKEVALELEKIAGNTGVDLDARFSEIRTKETNISNLVADAMRLMLDTDVCLINSGSLRIDDIIEKGILRWKHVDTLFPMQDDTVIIRIKGEDLLEAFENSVSALPKMDGCFPCISGAKIKFDSSKPAFERILEASINGQPIQDNELYTMATKEYLYDGKDGFKSLVNAEMIADGEDCPTLDTLFINFFQLMTKRNSKWFSTKKKRVERGLEIIHNEDRHLLTEDEEGNPTDQKYFTIYPKVDGRLVNVAEE